MIKLWFSKRLPKDIINSFGKAEIWKTFDATKTCHNNINWLFQVHIAASFFINIFNFLNYLQAIFVWHLEVYNQSFYWAVFLLRCVFFVFWDFINQLLNFVYHLLAIFEDRRPFNHTKLFQSFLNSVLADLLVFCD